VTPELELGENRILYTDQSGSRNVRTTFEWVERDATVPPAPSAGRGAFEWSAVPGAADYQFELGDEPGLRWALSPAFERLVKENRTGLTVPGLLNPGQTYYWRVRARSAEGVWGPWSQTWKYVPEGPGMPLHVRFEERNPGLLTLAWEGVPQAARYRVYASDEKGFTVGDEPREQAVGNQTVQGLFPGQKTAVFPASYLAETARPFYELNPRHAFYRVVAVDAQGRRGGSSEYVEAPRPWIYTQPVTEAKAGAPYRYEAKTIRSIGDLSYRDFGPGASYQSAYWNAEEPRFSFEDEMPRCGNFPPKWLKIDAKTGVLSGLAEPGEYQVNIRVEIHGRAYLQSFPLKVR
jgi:hypothetical protein